MYKNIAFVMSELSCAERLGVLGVRHFSKHRLVIHHFEVNLDALSPGARAIAENIYTTENADDLSLIYVSGPTVKELMIKDHVPDDEIKKYELMMGNKYMNSPVTEPWVFDKLRHYETPEEYFERQVSKMKEYGWLYISGTYRFSERITINYKL